MFNRKYRKPTRMRTKHPILSKVCLCGAILCLGAGVYGGSSFFFNVSHAPKINKTALKSSNNTSIYDSNNHLVSKLGAEQRNYVKYKDIPALEKNALISIEDRNFYKEHGLSPTRTLGAGLSDLKGSGGLQGGSTLSQQLVKLSVFNTTSKDQTLKRKMQEAWLSVKINHNMSKDKILEYYMNKVYMDNQCYGFETASEYYFNKPLKDLDLPEAALLAGMPQSPTVYDAYRFPKIAKKRRNEVLSAMVSNHKISAKQAQSAQKVSIKHGLVSAQQAKTNQVKRENKEKAIDGYLKGTLEQLHSLGYKENAGLKIYTNMNAKNQQKMYELSNGNKQIKYPDNKFQLGGALVQAQSGKINAMVGGRTNSKNYQPLGLDRALQTSRSTGSICKPYEDVAPLLQFDKDMGSQRIFDDGPMTYPGTRVTIKDFDNRYEGPMSMQEGLVQSRNVVAIKELQDVGIKHAKRYIERLGINPGNNYSLQNGIGLYSSPLQQANIAATITNGGVYHQPSFITKIKEPNGTVHYFHPRSYRVMPKGVAYILIHMMKGEFTNPKAYSQGAKIKGLNEWAKTGTTELTNAYKGHQPSGYSAMDSWFLAGAGGYNNGYGFALWNGYDNPDTAGNYINSNDLKLIQKFYKQMMSYAMKNGGKNTGWKQPNDVGYNDYAGYHLK